MSSTAADLKKISVKRCSTAGASGFLVKQSEETIKNLRKENFNLKLKMYLVENNKSRPSTAPEGDQSGGYNEVFELLQENESFRLEIQEKLCLLKSALEVIKNLEEQKLKSEARCRDLMLEQHFQEFHSITVRKSAED